MVIGILLVPAGIGILLVPASGIVGRKMPQVPASVVGRNDAQGYSSRKNDAPGCSMHSSRKNDVPCPSKCSKNESMLLVPASVGGRIDPKIWLIRFI